MKYGKLIGLACASGVLGLVAVSVAQPSGEQPEMPLPPGWTMDDMMACVQAGTPGEHQAELVKEAGTWEGTGTMWMGPGGEAMPTTVVMTITPIMDGRYIRVEMNGEFPGMGPYTGMGINGYDNVAGRYVSDWVDNHSSGIMRGNGQKSADGTMTWSYEYMCPITKKPAVLRQVEKIKGAKRTMEMFGADPKSGVEYKMMAYEFTRKP